MFACLAAAANLLPPCLPPLPSSSLLPLFVPFYSSSHPILLPTVVHSILGYAPSVDPVGPLVGQGLAYAGFAAVLWPSVPLVVEQRFIGLGYGVVTSVQNLGLASFPLIVSGIASAKVGSTSLALRCAALLFAARLSSALLFSWLVACGSRLCFSLPLSVSLISLSLFLCLSHLSPSLTHSRFSPPLPSPPSPPLFSRPPSSPRAVTSPAARTSSSPWPRWACWWASTSTCGTGPTGVSSTTLPALLGLGLGMGLGMALALGMALGQSSAPASVLASALAL